MSPRIKSKPLSLPSEEIKTIKQKRYGKDSTSCRFHSLL
nr:MAG TPA: hypothetical protein [Caudoviricetes sp.]DAL09129.1 MAG TPA_asm: hypothetical protein [Caudoviricetes sp.]DAV21049.1 MAG TPA: hypothetical protein [Caudoviricetes sp.]